MSRATPTVVEPLLPVTLSPGGIRYAPGVIAGPWVFATGHKGVDDYAGPMSPAVMRSGAPSYDKPKLQREAERIFANLGRVLAAGGCTLKDVVRVDQNYTTSRAVEPYHDARRAIMKDHIPPSTSTLTQSMLLAGQEIEVHMMALVPGGEMSAQHIRSQDQQVHPSSGYSLGLAAGDLIFVAGRMADSLTFGEGLAAEARMPPGHLWKGDPVKLEAEFIIRRKIEPVLQAAGSSLAHALKWQVYLRDPEDFAAFNEVWRRTFPDGGPATTLVPTATPGFFLQDARIEINCIAVRKDGHTPRLAIDAGTTPAFARYPQGIRAGNLLFISGLLPIDEEGLIAAARPDPRMPYFGCSVQAQMRHMLASAEAICATAGTSLANVVRIQQYHTALAEFYPAYQVWEERLPGQHLPFSAVGVPFLPAPGASVMLDLWVYVP